MQISRPEKVLLILFFIATWAVLTAYAGAPIYSDEFMYIDHGLRGDMEPSYANRYTHVYLQKLFMEIAPTPLWGTRAFWGFLMALTAALIYYHGRTFTADSSPLHGFIALALFFSLPFITEYSGEPAVDITAMAMVFIYLTVYLAAVRNENRRRELIVVMGAMAYLLLKTKETTIFIHFLLTGLMLDEDGRWGWKNFWPLAKRLLIGFAAAVVLMILLDWAIVGNPLFAISPATWKQIFTHYDYGFQFYTGPTSWYKVYFLNIILVPFLLYLVSSLKIQEELPVQRKLVLMYPLLMAGFVTVNMMKIPWGFIERFYFPALPFVVFIAPQFLKIDLPKTWKKKLWFGLLLAASAALLLVIRAWLKHVSWGLHFDFGRFLDSMYYPVLISILLAGAIWMKRYTWAQAVVPVFCIAALLFSPLLYTQKYFMRYPKVQERYEEIMQPFIAFDSELDIAEDERMYISSDLKRGLDMLGDDPNDITAFYNFYFDERITRENVFIGYQRVGMFDALTNKDFVWGLITAVDWEAMDETEQKEIQAIYTPLEDPTSQFYLLMPR